MAHRKANDRHGVSEHFGSGAVRQITHSDVAADEQRDGKRIVAAATLDGLAQPILTVVPCEKSRNGRFDRALTRDVNDFRRHEGISLAKAYSYKWTKEDMKRSSYTITISKTVHKPPPPIHTRLLRPRKKRSLRQLTLLTGLYQNRPLLRRSAAVSRNTLNDLLNVRQAPRPVEIWL